MYRFSAPDSIADLLHVDRLSWVMSALIVWVLVSVIGFSRRYMAGDRQALRQRGTMALLGASVLLMVCADHLLVLFAAWALSNLLLVRLMVHKAQWHAARQAGRLALGTFGLGMVLLAAAFALLMHAAGTASLQQVIAQADGAALQWPLLLIALVAMTQSAAWPFHRWLLSSLNSPTPVSALMHAGLVNGGGFLLVRFAPLYLAQPLLMKGLFMVGLATALMGSFCKLLQTDIKRMLACSTMGQMGFMLLQCGAGLFAPAVSHLCWHGLFKAYLFLSAGSVVQEQRRPLQATPRVFAVACLPGVAGMLAFAWVSATPLGGADTRWLLLALAFMAATQLAQRVLAQGVQAGRVAAATAAAIGTGALYGASLWLMDTLLAPLGLMQPQPLGLFYGAGLLAMLLVWAGANLNLMAQLQQRTLWKRLYMAAVIASQPHPSTITTTRTAYSY